MHWASKDPSTRICTLGDGSKLFESLGHVRNVQPLCHLVVFFIPGTEKRGISTCVPERELSQYGQLAVKMDKQLNDLINETESTEETNWANLDLNVFHAIATLINAILWIYRPRVKAAPITREITNTSRTVARRARDSSVD